MFLTDADGKLLTFLVTPGQRHEATMFEPLMEAGAVKLAGRGRPRLRSKSMVADKGYSCDRIRNYLANKAIKPVIPLRSNQGRDDTSTRKHSGSAT